MTELADVAGRSSAAAPWPAALSGGHACPLADCQPPETDCGQQAALTGKVVAPAWPRRRGEVSRFALPVPSHGPGGEISVAGSAPIPRGGPGRHTHHTGSAP